MPTRAQTESKRLAYYRKKLQLQDAITQSMIQAILGPARSPEKLTRAHQAAAERLLYARALTGRGQSLTYNGIHGVDFHPPPRQRRARAQQLTPEEKKLAKRLLYFQKYAKPPHASLTMSRMKALYGSAGRRKPTPEQIEARKLYKRDMDRLRRRRKRTGLEALTLSVMRARPSYGVVRVRKAAAPKLSKKKRTAMTPEMKALRKRLRYWSTRFPSETLETQANINALLATRPAGKKRFTYAKRAPPLPPRPVVLMQPPPGMGPVPPMPANYNPYLAALGTALPMATAVSASYDPGLPVVYGGVPIGPHPLARNPQSLS